MGLFSKLLIAYPYNADILHAEAKKDIPPLYRGAVWAVLLNVIKDEVEDEFSRLNIVSEHVSDRQLQVDIPRCHQVYFYNFINIISKKKRFVLINNR